MRNFRKVSRKAEPDHLSVEDFCRYVSVAPGSVEFSELERHLTECPDCREELAGILSLLRNDYEESARQEPAPSDIAQTYTLIKRVAREERAGRRGFRGGLRWLPAAAAAAVILIAGGWGLKYLSDTARSGEYLAQARTALEEVMVNASPRGLRTDLPFSSTATVRDVPEEERLDNAETLFHQALAVRGGISEAHLGLGAIYLSRSRYPRALSSFQAVLEADPSNQQALIGRGVTKYEQAWEAEDPVERSILMKDALTDFDSVLEGSPDAQEARYNRIWVLYDTGRHREALREIDVYLQADSLSIWSERLKELRTRIGTNDSGVLEQEIERAGQKRDAATLASIAKARPESVPAAIRACLRKSLTAEDSAAAGLRWAADKLETGYAAATGDVSYKRLLVLYAELTPELETHKKQADADYQRLLDLYDNGKPKTVLQESLRLEIGRAIGLGGSHCRRLGGTDNGLHRAGAAGGITPTGARVGTAGRGTQPDLLEKAGIQESVQHVSRPRSVGGESEEKHIGTGLLL